MIGAITAGIISRTPSSPTPPVSGYYAWYDASVAASITSSGGLVSQWSDLSGNGLHVTQATSTYQPTTGTTSQNGKNVLAFTTSKLITTASFTSNALTVFYVALKTAAGDSTQTYSRLTSFWKTPNNDYNNTDGMLGAYSSTNNSGYAPSAYVYRNSASVAGNTLTYNVANCTSWRLNGTALTFIHNGNTTSGTTSATSLNSDRLTLGTASDFILPGGDSFLNGWIAEVIIYKSVLSDSDMSSVNSYLKTKWNTV